MSLSKEDLIQYINNLNVSETVILETLQKKEEDKNYSTKNETEQNIDSIKDMLDNRFDITLIKCKNIYNAIISATNNNEDNDLIRELKTSVKKSSNYNKVLKKIAAYMHINIYLFNETDLTEIHQYYDNEKEEFDQFKNSVILFMDRVDGNVYLVKYQDVLYKYKTQNNEIILAITNDFKNKLKVCDIKIHKKEKENKEDSKKKTKDDDEPLTNKKENKVKNTNNYTEIDIELKTNFNKEISKMMKNSSKLKLKEIHNIAEQCGIDLKIGKRSKSKQKLIDEINEYICN